MATGILKYKMAERINPQENGGCVYTCRYLFRFRNLFTADSNDSVGSMML